MHHRIGAAQRCTLLVVQLICVVTLVKCSPPNLIDASRIPPASDQFQVASTMQSMRREADQSAVAEANVTQDVAASANQRLDDDANDVNEQRSITIRLEDLHDFLQEFMKDDAMEQDNSLGRQSGDARAFITDLLFNEKLIRRVKKFTEKYIFNVGSASSTLNSVIPSAGRVFFFKGQARQWLLLPQIIWHFCGLSGPHLTFVDIFCIHRPF